VTPSAPIYDAHLSAVTGPTRGSAGAAWTCDACNVWWGSQNSAKPTTKFLLQLPEALSDQLPWDQYRGWKLAIEEAAYCPECGRPTGRIVFSAA
jgi:hypothetical protein